MTVIGTYDPYLVALSFVVACLASYAALDLGGRIKASRGWARLAWLATAAIAMGGGIWSMHFIAMLAFFMPMPVSFDFGLTILSLVVAIGVTGVGFFVIGTRQATALQFVPSGIVMGIGIVAMHYTGMAAAEFTARPGMDEAHGVPSFAQTELALAIAAITFVILMLALVTSTFDRKLAKLAERETALLRESEE